jgi:murein DD-endopeptidase MepM/ murein hydrolase activator NlpD
MRTEKSFIKGMHIFKKKSIKCVVKKCIVGIMVAALTISLGGRTLVIFGDNKSDLNDAKNKQQNVQNQLDATKKYIEDLNRQKGSIEDVIKSLDSQMATMNASLDALNTQISDLETTIANTQIQLEEAQKDADVQYDHMKLRIKFMYEHNEETYLGMLLNAEDMADLLSKAEYINQLTKYDRQMLEKYKETVDFIAKTKSDLESEKEQLVTMQGSLQDQVAALSLLQTEKNNQLNSLNQTVAAEQTYYSKLEAEQQKLEKDIAAIEESIRKEEAAKSSVTNYDGGKFKWPTTSTRITSDYGDTDGRSAPHKGIDVGAVTRGVSGDPIYAAYEGKVVIATYSSSAGNYIMIYHGNGLYTRYLHCSSLLVSVGDYVKTGQKIGLMGTTGNSTGAHLHFDVRKDGAYVNPWSYFNR